ncbi:MAG TPA: molybdopterin-dependent oxidoreductase [Nitrososphaeraceae archaeon]|nr:molybdopterin-dependent oxidoreductase [Nitrososphaeraceae archaeon]
MVQRSSHTYASVLLVGLVGGAIAIAISLALRTFFSAIFIPELASQTLFSITPGEVESQAVETLGPIAKYSAFIGALIVNLIVYGILSLIVYRIYAKVDSDNSFLVTAAISSGVSYVAMLIISFILLVIADIQIQALSIQTVTMYLILPQIAFGFASAYFYKNIQPRATKVAPKGTADYSRTTSSSISSGVDQNRRLLIKAGLASVVIIPLLYLGLNNLLFPRESTQSRLPLESQMASKPRPVGFEDPSLTALLASEITPTDLFYRVDINPVPPTVDVNSWRLVVKGLVNNPLTITYEQLKAIPSVPQIATLECISNKIANDFIGTAIWNGIKLKGLLDEAGVKPSAKYIVFRCADGYDVGIPLERGFQEGSILAHGMNGETLNAKHGFPVRAIIPGLYGMMNPKWITEIELIDRVYEGYWQKKGWANNARYNTHSYIVIPGNAPIRGIFRNLGSINTIVGEQIPIAGVAFAGDRGISRIQVSSDGGVTWKDAKIKNPLSPYSWVIWTTELDITNKRNYKIVVRATDNTGKIQTGEVREPFPSGATGYHMVDVQASS